MPIPGIVASVNRALGEEEPGGVCDEYWDDVVLALHMDGEDESTTFTDEKEHAATLEDSPEIRTLQSAFVGGASAYFNGNSSITFEYSTDFNAGTQDITVDLWVYFGAAAGTEQRFFSLLNTSAGSWASRFFLTKDDEEYITAYVYTAESTQYTVTSSVELPLGEWVHIAFSRASGVYRLYQGGAKVAESDAIPLVSFDNLGVTVGQSYPSDAVGWIGYLDDVRFTIGASRYTGDIYTVPTTPFGNYKCGIVCDPALANVVFAMHMDDTPASDGEYTFTDTLSALPTQSGNASWTDVAWNGSVFCAVGGSNNLAATSPDGITWTLRTMPAVAGWLSIAWNGTVFCAISGGYAATSPDGITWTLSEALWTSHGWHSIFSNGTIFVALSVFGYSAVSSDGVTWAVTANTLFKTNYGGVFAWNGSVFCLVNPNSNKAITSPDGITWTSRTLPLSAYWTSVAWNGTVFCAVANGNVAATSPDGITWTRRNLSDYHTWLSIVACEDTFYTFALGTNKVAFSRDGIIWEQRWVEGLAINTDWGTNAWGDSVLCTLYGDDLCLLTELTFPTATAAVFTEETGRTITGLDGAKITAVDYKFGSGALTGGGLTAAYSSDFDWWDDDFTIELFIRRIGATGWQDANGVPTLLGNRSASGSTAYWAFGPLNNGKLSFQYWNGALVTLTSASALTGIDTSWLHLMMTQKDGTIYLFSQGTKVAEAAVSGTPQSSSSQPLTLFQGGGLVPNGYVDEVRIVKGVARYITDFTPPTTPFGEFEC